MEKPLLVKRQEFVDELRALIYGAELPLVIISPIVSSAAEALQNALNVEYQKEMAEWASKSAEEEAPADG